MLQATLKTLEGSYGKRLVGQIFVPTNEELSKNHRFLEVLAVNLGHQKWPEFKARLREAGAVKHGPSYVLELPAVGLAAFNQANNGLVTKAWIPKSRGNAITAQLNVRMRKELEPIVGDELALLYASNLTLLQGGENVMAEMNENANNELPVAEPPTYIEAAAPAEASAALQAAADYVRAVSPAPSPAPVTAPAVDTLEAEAAELRAEAAALAAQALDPANAVLCRYLSLDTAARRLVEAGFSYISRLTNQGVIDRSQLYDDFRVEGLRALVTEAERVGGDPKRLALGLRLKFNVQTLKKVDGSTVVHNYRGSSHSAGQVLGYIVGAVGATVVAHRMLH